MARTKNDLEKELQEEIEEEQKRWDMTFTRSPIPILSEIDRLSLVMNNFFCKFPGGSQRLSDEEYRGLDNNAVVGYRIQTKKSLDEGTKFGDGMTLDKIVSLWKKRNSKKFNSITYRQFYQDIDDALREAGVSDETMQKLYEMHERHKAARETSEGFDYHESSCLLGNENAERILLQYRAYAVLRKKGYSKNDLTA